MAEATTKCSGSLMRLKTSSGAVLPLTDEDIAIAAALKPLFATMYARKLCRQYPRADGRPLKICCSTSSIPRGPITAGLFGVVRKGKLLFYVLEHAWNVTDQSLNSMKMTTAGLWNKADNEVVIVESTEPIVQDAFDIVDTFPWLESLLEEFKMPIRWARINAAEEKEALQGLPLELSEVYSLLERAC